ncbi:MAG: type II toxin-antitoxin system Phd/YefM family antitoxin [Erysipelotrichaceae bacterium]|nr:type II toxin-antitoxin system Phd/YefM family antitoxin [Erysipelotrichaceae bacterium]
MTIRASADIRTNYNAVIEECRQTGEPVYLTKNGQVEAVVMDIASFERREQILRAQQMVLEAYIDNLAGAKSFSSEEVKSMMDRLIDDEE